MSELASPLRSIVQKLASQKISGPAAKVKKRYVGATNIVVAVCDVSDSMRDSIGSLGMNKHQQLKVALEDTLLSFPDLRIIAFSSTAQQIRDAKELPEPNGSTNLQRALQLAQELKPRKTIILSDGLPDSTTLATEAAENLTGAIDTIYCGPEQHPGAEFLHGLSRLSGGRGVTWEGRAQLAETFRLLIEAPAGV